MNVLHVSKYYYPQVGGLEHVVRTLAEGFVERGHDVRVLASVSSGTGSTETINGVVVRKVANAGEVLSVPTSPTFPLALRDAARGGSGDGNGGIDGGVDGGVDVVHFHLPNPLAVCSQLLAGPTDPGIVVTYHSDIVRQATALALYRPLLHRFLGRADRVLPTSPRLLEHSRELGRHEEECTVVPLSIDLEDVTDDGSSFRLPGDPDRPTLLFVGRLSYYKGVEYLVDAMADVDADLLVVGDGDRREALERRARDRRVDGKVAFLGRVSDEKLDCCYESADALVLPSVAPSEAFGVVQLEAMARGLPVVNTDLPTGVPWVSPDGETGLTVPPGDARALAEALDELLGAPDRLEHYGENARERVEARFGRERMLDRTEDVYEEVLAG